MLETGFNLSKYEPRYAIPSKFQLEAASENIFSHLHARWTGCFCSTRLGAKYFQCQVVCLYLFGACSIRREPCWFERDLSQCASMGITQRWNRRSLVLVQQRAQRLDGFEGKATKRKIIRFAMLLSKALTSLKIFFEIEKTLHKFLRQAFFQLSDIAC